MSTTLDLQIDGDAFKRIDAALAQIPIIHRAVEIKRAMRRGAQVVADRYAELLPRSVREQMTGVHLADMPGVRVNDYELSIVGMSAVRRAHKKQRSEADKGFPTNLESLLEHGHDIVRGGTKSQKKGAREGYASKSAKPEQRGTGKVVGHVPGGHYLERAVQQTQAAVEAEITESLTRAVERLFS